VTTSDLSRFVDAQDHIYPRALAEIRSGRKASHWMWFIFPQLGGLGSSEMARRYALSSLDEARAYLRHPVLGQRVLEIVGALQELGSITAEEVFGTVDAMKLRSSLTLFAAAAPQEPHFAEALQRWFGGVPDERTIELLRLSS
jgi:uncharacterized protein (DUF1810 family)